MVVKPTFHDWQCAGQRVFFRADLNVPLAHGTMLSDRRLRAIQPTLDFLLHKGAQVILATHIGRPTTHEPSLSTEQLIPWFLKKGYSIEYAATPAAIQKLPFSLSIILLENLRFFPGEKAQNKDFAQELAALAPWYVNDAFGTLHRADTSLTLLAASYAPSHRSIGFLIEKELSILSPLKEHPRHPTLFILGGGKPTDKLPLIAGLAPIADTLFVGPALSFTFLKADGMSVGRSFVDTDALAKIPALIKTLATHHTELRLPTDYQIARGDAHGPLSYVAANTIPIDGYGISVGPRTVTELKTFIARAGTIFYNGLMGWSERTETLTGVGEIFTAMAQSSATTVVAGGDSIALVDQLALTGITHCITGGGSTLTYLSHQPLPGLEPFLKNGTKTN